MEQDTSNSAEAETVEESTEEAKTQETETNAEDANQNIIEVANPTKEEMAAITKNITANYDASVITKAVIFNFKKSTDKDTKIETIRKPVELAIPYPSVEGIIHILEKGDKGLELLIESVEAVINAQARDMLYEDLTLTASTIDVNKLSWEFIANIPKAQRRGGGIPKETWESFAADYVEVMPTATGKTVEQCTNAAKILQSKLGAVRTNEPVLTLLVEQLAVYADKSPNAEEYQECVAFLLQKAETFLNVTEEELLSNL